MSEDSGPSSFEVSNKMSQPHANSGSGASVGGGGGGGKMLPMEGHDLSSAIAAPSVELGHFESMDSLFASINNENAFSGNALDGVAGAVGQHFTKEASGEQGLKLESMGQGERAAPPTISGDLQLKHASFRGSDGGQSAGG